MSKRGDLNISGEIGGRFLRLIERCLFVLARAVGYGRWISETWKLRRPKARSCATYRDKLIVLYIVLINGTQ